MPLAADCFRCPGTRCPDFIRETCRRFVDLKAGVGPVTPYADVSTAAYAGHPYAHEFKVSVCFYKWPVVP